MEDADAVWVETTDGGLLHQLFGYYPTLHDAVVRSIEISRPSDRVTFVVDYLDMIGDDPDSSLKVRIRLEWSDVVEMTLPLEIDCLFGLSFRRRDDSIESNLEVMPGGFGTIVSRGVEAFLVQIDPGDDDSLRGIRYF